MISRRRFLGASAIAAVSAGHFSFENWASEAVARLPKGNAPKALAFPHFPDRLHAFIWRNWTLVPLEKLAKVIGATPREARELGASMGLPRARAISKDQQRRSYITIIRRNWHLLPYEQLLELLDWTPEHMAYMLREDDFLYIKLGSHKPECPRLRYAKPEAAERERAREISEIVRAEEPQGNQHSEPLFSFVRDLSARPAGRKGAERPATNGMPKFCYSYFALYGDPLLEPELDPYPDGYLERLAGLGVNGVWLQGTLAKLAPLPWLNENARERAKRLGNLRALAKRAARHGIKIYLYLNEPRAMPQEFFKSRPEWRGAPDGEYAAVCTSNPEVREALANAVGHVCQAVPELGGFFTITASENPTNCWSHGRGTQCPRCAKRSPAEVIAEVITVFQQGIDQAKSQARLLAWDWGWHDAWAPEVIKRLPEKVALMSVSEWSIPIQRGGVDSVVGEYSISAIGPGPRALRHWELARERGLQTLAKIQAGNTWELSAVPYIPAVENVARHAAGLKGAGVDGLMLGWTLGGYPSPNVEVACAITNASGSAEGLVDEALHKVARGRFGGEAGPEVVRAWKAFSAAFSEFPYHIGVVYNAPMQCGPSNLLWAEPTGYTATMVGFPYDDLKTWRQQYPAEIFVGQFRKIAEGFEAAIEPLRKLEGMSREETRELVRELNVAEAAAIHFQSTANQAEFVHLRAQSKGAGSDGSARERMRAILESEISLARRLHAIQLRDSRIGFEASNQYYYVPQDLLEKILNCRFLLKQLES